MKYKISYANGEVLITREQFLELIKQLELIQIDEEIYISPDFIKIERIPSL